MSKVFEIINHPDYGLVEIIWDDKTYMIPRSKYENISKECVNDTITQKEYHYKLMNSLIEYIKNRLKGS